MKILVADDCRDTALSMTLLLQLMGHEAASAFNGLEAVSLALRLRPDAALLDICMPQLDGFETAARIRAALPSILLVAITGWPNLLDDRSEPSEFDHCLLKPVEIGRLAALLTPGSQGIRRPHLSETSARATVH